MVRQTLTEAVEVGAVVVEVEAAAEEGWYPVSEVTFYAWTWTASCSCAMTYVQLRRNYSQQATPRVVSLASAAVRPGWHSVLEIPVEELSFAAAVAMAPYGGSTLLGTCPDLRATCPRSLLPLPSVQQPEWLRCERPKLAQRPLPESRSSRSNSRRQCP